MKPEFISIIALVLSLSSTLFTIGFTLRQIWISSILASNAAMINVEKSLASAITALKFHGINEDDLEQAGVTPEEFAYLLTSFTAGAIYYRTLLWATRKPFKEGDYRYTMCSQPSTRRAWPLIQKLTRQHIFYAKIDKTIALIEEREKRHGA